MLTTVIAVWMLVGMVILGLARIKVPQDTPLGKEHPIRAWTSFTFMILLWPVALANRSKFALYGNPQDENNPSWLRQL